MSSIRRFTSNPFASLRAALVGGTAPGWDALEPRQQLAGDMAVTVTDPVVEYSRLARGFVIKSDVIIRNVGDAPVQGPLRLLLSLSTDTSPGNDYTVYDRTYPGTIGINQRFRPDIAIPVPHDLLGANGVPALEPGNYHLRAFILLPDGTVENTANNNVFSQGTFPLTYTWGGTGEGATRTVLETTLRTEQSIRFEIDGPGRGVLDTSNGRLVVNLFDTTARSSLWMTTGVRGTAAVLNGITINGSLNYIRGASVSVNGNITVDGSLARVNLASLANSAFSIGGASSRFLSASLGTVVNVSLDSAVGISEIVVSSWTNNDGNTDAIVAPSIGRISSTGTFSPNLVVSGNLGRTTISGAVGGIWDIVGSAGSVRIASPTDEFRLNARQRIDSLVVEGTLRGKIASARIGSVRVNGDVTNASLLGGTDFGSNGDFGGTGNATDSFVAGSIGPIRITGNVSNTAIAVSANPGADALFLTSDDTFASSDGRLGGVRIDGTLTQSFFIAPIVPARATIDGVTFLTRGDDRFRVTLP
jgi:hypothetical protein